jgi:ABC-type oligopeptide transport system ATPase subunit
MTNPSPPLLEVCDLSVSFDHGRHIAVDQASLTLRKGETLGLVGSSGAGKSTIARAICGLVSTQGGEIKIDGIAKNQMARQQLQSARQRIQIVFQEPGSSLSPKRTVEQILLEPLLHFRIGDPLSRSVQIAEALKTVGLDADVLQRYPRQFSTGQQQRIAIARALVSEPDVLIADEAVSALDVSVQAQILQLLRRLQKQRNIALLFISHDLGVVRQMADQIVVMYRGQVMEQAPASVFFEHAAHPYSRALLKMVKSDGIGNQPIQASRLHHSRLHSADANHCLYTGNCVDKMPLCETTAANIYNLGNKTAPHCVRCHLYKEANEDEH